MELTVLSPIWGMALILTPLFFWKFPERLRSPVMVAMTASILMITSPITIGLLAFSTIAAWVSYLKCRKNGALIALGCAIQLAPFIAWRLVPPEALEGVSAYLIPIGLAFIGLRGVHYLIEAYRDALPKHEFSDLLDYFFFLPTIIAGPIHRFPPFVKDSQRRRWNDEYFSQGLERMLFGYVKVTVIANLLVNYHLVNFIAKTTVEGSRPELYLSMIQKGLNGYVQFSGYSDIAIGFALLLGYRVMENFNYPLLKPNVQQFWAAWHMSLTSWCRDYVYTPVFSLTRLRSLGIIMSMLVLGLWHEFTPRYIAWGLYNGSIIVLWYQWRRLAGERLEASLKDNAIAQSAWHVFAVLLTLNFIFFGFLLVQRDSLAESVTIMGRILGIVG